MESESKVFISKDANVKVIFDYDNLNICIENSWQIVRPIAIEELVERIMESDLFAKMWRLGYTRTKESLIREWKAHNILYRWGYEKERTGSVDFSQYESRPRRIGYFILSILYRD